MESTSQAGGGPSMPIGSPSNRAEGQAGGGREGKGGGENEPVPAYEVTTMPLPKGRCVGKYTDEAKQAAIEGTVVHVVSGLGYGLTQAAIAAAKACTFSPGEKGDQPVPVRIREFKIRFFLQQGDE
jgi:hypothetical protein